MSKDRNKKGTSTPIKTDENGERDSEGRFIEGNNGKPKGAQNKTTKAIKKILVDFLHDKVDDVQNLWQHLDDREKIALWLLVARLVMPKPEEEQEKDGNTLVIVRRIVGHTTNEVRRTELKKPDTQPE